MILAGGGSGHAFGCSTTDVFVVHPVGIDHKCGARPPAAGQGTVRSSVDVTAIFWYAQAAPPADAAADPSTGPVIIIGLALITLAGTALTAIGPQIPEILRARLGRAGNATATAPEGPAGDPSPQVVGPAPPVLSNQTVQSANAGLSMVEDAVLDYRSQRDAAMGRYDEAREDLEEAKDVIREQAVYIAQLEGRLGIGRQNYGGRHGPQPDASQQGYYR